MPDLSVHLVLRFSKYFAQNLNQKVKICIGKPVPTNILDIGEIGNTAGELKPDCTN